MNTDVSVDDLDRARWTRALDMADEGIISDVRQPDDRVVFARQRFVRPTGYSAAEVLGRDCRLLRGPETDPSAAAAVRQAVPQRRFCVVEILYCWKSGTPFWNRLAITPVHNAAGDVTHFIGVQSDVTARRAAENAL
jgi:PAS domain S-box-containing protein